MKRLWISLTHTGLAVALAASPCLAAPPIGFYGPHRPRLVVFMVVDQMRADTLTRFADQFLPARQHDGKPGGLRYLMENGAYHSQCYIDHLPCHTAVGHATLATGALPSATESLPTLGPSRPPASGWKPRATPPFLS